VGAWTAAGGLAAFTVFRRNRRFMQDTPCIQDAIRELQSSSQARSTLGEGEIQVANWPRVLKIYHNEGFSSASFQVQGSSGFVQVLMSARQEAAEKGAHDDDDEGLARGTFSFYWSKPWELKWLFLEKASAVGKALAFWRKKEKAEDLSREGEHRPWKVDALVFLPNADIRNPVALIGEPQSLPDYESMIIRRDGESKGDASHRRLHIVMGAVAGAAFFMGCLRLGRSLKVSQGYGYVKNRLIAHHEVVAQLGPSARIQTSSGTFGAEHIDAKLRLLGDSNTAADVEIVATKDGDRRNPWRIAMARMRVSGRQLNLNKLYF